MTTGEEPEERHYRDDSNECLTRANGRELGELRGHGGGTGIRGESGRIVDISLITPAIRRGSRRMMSRKKEDVETVLGSV